MRLTTAALFPSIAAAISCTPGTLHPVWSLDPINLSSYYTYSSPSASGTSLGSISFTLSSDQVDYNTTCTGSSVNPLGQFYSFQIFQCARPTNDTKDATSFSFDTSSNVISVNSSWTYGGSVLYSASASGKVNLQCTTSTWNNPSWSEGQIYSNTSTTCAPGSLVIDV